MLQPRSQILLQPADDDIVIPAGLGEKSLQHPRRCGHRLRQVFRIASLLGLHQQTLQVLPAALPPLLATERRRKVGMKFLEGLVHPFQS